MGWKIRISSEVCVGCARYELTTPITKEDFELDCKIWRFTMSYIFDGASDGPGSGTASRAGQPLY